MFTRVAARYDLLNQPDEPRRPQGVAAGAVNMLRPKPGDLVVDVATGTGDMALLLASRT